MEREEGIRSRTVADQGDARPKKAFLSKDDPAAVLAALQTLVSQAVEDKVDHPRGEDVLDAGTRPGGSPEG